MSTPDRVAKFRTSDTNHLFCNPIPEVKGEGGSWLEPFDLGALQAIFSRAEGILYPWPLWRTSDSTACEQQFFRRSQDLMELSAIAGVGTRDRIVTGLPIHGTRNNAGNEGGGGK